MSQILVYLPVEFRQTKQQYDDEPCLRLYRTSAGSTPDQNSYSLQIRGAVPLRTDNDPMGNKSMPRNLIATISITEAQIRDLFDYVEKGGGK